MMMTYSDVRAPAWADAEHTAINCEVLFDAFAPDWMPFGARADDPEAHGREIFARLIAGEFGPIAEYTGS